MLRLRGIPLAWNWVDPRWLPDDPQKAMDAQFERIRECVSRFKGQIDIWDVVNEATDYTRAEQKKAAPKLTNGILKIGLDQYLRRAFKAARDANQDAKLIINDYRTDEAFENKVLSVLVDDKKSSLYDVIGIQSHMHAGFWGIEKVWEVCNRFAKFNKPIHYTETTLLSGQQGWGLRAKSNDPHCTWSTNAEGEKRQAEQAGLFYSMLFSHPSVEALTWWDFSDQGAWMSAPAGLLRADMSLKPVYEKLHSLIKDKWWTRTEITANESTAKFTGFLGSYKVIAKVDYRSLTGTFSLDKDSKNITVNLT
jgi:endo-1,4-beta-xylanase